MQAMGGLQITTQARLPRILTHMPPHGMRTLTLNAAHKVHCLRMHSSAGSMRSSSCSISTTARSSTISSSRGQQQGRQVRPQPGAASCRTAARQLSVAQGPPTAAHHTAQACTISLSNSISRSISLSMVNTQHA